MANHIEKKPVVVIDNSYSDYIRQIRTAKEALEPLNFTEPQGKKIYDNALENIKKLREDPGYASLNKETIKEMNGIHEYLVARRLSNLYVVVTSGKPPLTRENAKKSFVSEFSEFMGSPAYNKESKILTQLTKSYNQYKEEGIKEKKTEPVVAVSTAPVPVTTLAKKEEKKKEVLTKEEPKKEVKEEKKPEIKKPIEEKKAVPKTGEELMEELWKQLADDTERKDMQKVVIDFLKGKKEEMTITVYNQVEADNYVKMLNYINKKQNLGSQEIYSVGNRAEVISSELTQNRVVTTTSIVMKKLFPEKDAQKKIENLNQYYKNAYENPGRADLYNTFEKEYSSVEKESGKYGKMISKEKLEEMYMGVLGRRQAFLTVMHYQNFEADPLNDTYKNLFLNQYKDSTSGEKGPLNTNKIYTDEFSTYIKKNLNTTYEVLFNRYNNVLNMLSIIDRIDKAARTDPRPEQKQALQEFNSAVGELKTSGAGSENIYRSLMQYQYGTPNLIEEYTQIMKDGDFRKWRDEFTSNARYPIELLQLELRTQYALFKNVVPELKRRTTYDENTLGMVAKALKAVDPIGHVNFLQNTLPTFIKYFPNEFDTVSVLAATYQEIFKSIPFIKIRNEESGSIIKWQERM